MYTRALWLPDTVTDTICDTCVEVATEIKDLIEPMRDRAVEQIVMFVEQVLIYKLNSAFVLFHPTIFEPHDSYNKNIHFCNFRLFVLTRSVVTFLAFHSWTLRKYVKIL